MHCQITHHGKSFVAKIPVKDGIYLDFLKGIDLQPYTSWTSLSITWCNADFIRITKQETTSTYVHTFYSTVNTIAFIV